MKEKSLGLNAILNGIKSVLSIIFPLITFPYVSRILQVENLGKYNFALSSVNYFILIAGLGISNYAIREGAKYREDKDRMSQFASEVFTINLFSMVLSYSLLLIAVFSIPKFYSYRLLIAIFSIEIFFRVIGTEWIFSIYEEFAYITKRSLIFNLVAVILLFTLVKKQEDYYIYAAITVFANAGNNILNFFRAKKLCKIKIVRRCNWKRHISPILLIFSTSVAATIFVSSDITILGFLSDDYHVGLYSVSVKIYKVVKSFLSSALIVSMPRLSNYWGTNKKDEFNKTFNSILNTMIVLVVPSVVGLFCLSKEVILLIADASFVDATISLRILSMALLVCLFGWLFNSCVLLPAKCEKQIFIALFISATLNVILNIILIPHFKQNAAAFTTFLAEGCSFIMQAYYSRHLVRINGIAKNVVTTLLGCTMIVTVCWGLKYFLVNTIFYIICAVSLSVVLYFAVMLGLKNQVVCEMVLTIKKKLQNESFKF